MCGTKVNEEKLDEQLAAEHFLQQPPQLPESQSEEVARLASNGIQLIKELRDVYGKLNEPLAALEEMENNMRRISDVAGLQVLIDEVYGSSSPTRWT
eukprot:5760677-Pleurochrysis_carterae.AAC.1